MNKYSDLLLILDNEKLLETHGDMPTTAVFSIVNFQLQKAVEHIACGARHGTDLFLKGVFDIENFVEVNCKTRIT